MSARPDLSGFTDKEIYEIAGALWDLNAIMCMLETMGLADGDVINVRQLMDTIDREAHLRRQVKRAVWGGGE